MMPPLGVDAGAVSVNTARREEIGLREFADIIWRGRWIVFGLTVLVTLGAGIAATLLPKQYSASTIVSPARDQDSDGLGGLSSLASQFGGVASLAGLSVGGNNDKAETVAVLQSAVLTQNYIRERNLLPVLFADDWDQAAGKWKQADSAATPTLWKANEFFKRKVRNVSENTKTGLVTLTITWTDPVLAAQWANDLVRMTNDYLRAKAIEKSERHIKYLTEQANATDVAQVRLAIYTVLESEIKNVMLAKGTDEYALKVIDPAIVPEIRSSPKRTVWVLAGFFAGLSIALLAVLLLNAWRDQPSA